MRLRSLAPLPFTFALALTLSLAAVPPEIATQLKDMGRVVNPTGTAKLYRPLQPKAPYPGVKVEREIKYGPDARMVLDVFAPERGGGSRPVLIYVAGGAGNKGKKAHLQPVEHPTKKSGGQDQKLSAS